MPGSRAIPAIGESGLSPAFPPVDHVVPVVLKLPLPLKSHLPTASAVKTLASGGPSACTAVHRLGRKRGHSGF